MSKKKKKKKSKSLSKSSETVQDAEGRQYHIGLAPGDVANTILLVGDPARAKKISTFFDKGSIRINIVNREFHTITGTYQKLPISVLATGIGPSNIEIVLIELKNIFPMNTNTKPILIRVGSSGGLQTYTESGDLVISTGAVRIEDSSLQFVENSYPAVADFEIITSLITAAEKLKFNFHVGITASASGFYGAQGRDIPYFPILNKNLPEELKERNVLNFEMESSTLFTLSSLGNFRSGTVCAVYANRPKGKFIEDDMKEKAEEDVILCGLTAALIINKMDETKKSENKKLWNAFLNIQDD